MVDRRFAKVATQVAVEGDRHPGVGLYLDIEQPTYSRDDSKTNLRICVRLQKLKRQDMLKTKVRVFKSTARSCISLWTERRLSFPRASVSWTKRIHATTCFLMSPTASARQTASPYLPFGSSTGFHQDAVRSVRRFVVC